MTNLFSKNNDEVMKAYELYKSGLSSIKIGELYGVKYHVILRSFKGLGLEIRSGVGKGKGRSTSLKGRKWSDGKWKLESIEAILYGQRNNRYTPEYGKKLSESQTGEKNTMVKLTEKKVIKIRQLYVTGDYSCAVLGEMFDISRQAVTDIVKERTWKHLLE